MTKPPRRVVFIDFQTKQRIKLMIESGQLQPKVIALVRVLGMSQYTAGNILRSLGYKDI
jgi:hypothetical protein